MDWRRQARATLREPLAHFLIGGAALFAFVAARGEPVDPASRVITIDAGQVTALAENWIQTWQRPPSPAEMDGIIRDYVKEEIYNREARRMGLDEDDAVVRRRLRAKMESLADDAVDNAIPENATLEAWYAAHRARYAADARLSFDQVFVRSDGDDGGRSRAAQVLDRLRKGADWHALGDPAALPPAEDGADRNAIAEQFGAGFAAALADAPQGRWIGPIESGFGLHLVRLRASSTTGAPRLAEVRQDVENDWRAATRKAREDAAYGALLSGYTIRIARP
ncbi:peptidyl-prolyl cis-trans isomerase [Novosphingobium tardum]|uniref:Parvulin-like PPIase n=1 Tax=Novosphingobium tardum TaxID=1538021 RepID=A0ABV8RRR3_9SPHN